MVHQLNFGREGFGDVEDQLIQSAGMVVAVVLAAGGVLHKAGFLRFGREGEGSRCPDSDCKKTMLRHDRRLEKGDAALKALAVAYNRMAAGQVKTNEAVSRIETNQAVLLGQLKVLGVLHNDNEG